MSVHYKRKLNHFYWLEMKHVYNKWFCQARYQAQPATLISSFYIQYARNNLNHFIT